MKMLGVSNPFALVAGLHGYQGPAQLPFCHPDFVKFFVTEERRAKAILCQEGFSCFAFDGLDDLQGTVV